MLTPHASAFDYEVDEGIYLINMYYLEPDPGGEYHKIKEE